MGVSRRLHLLRLARVQEQVVAAAYALVGFAMLGRHGYGLRRELASRGWPRAEGVVRWSTMLHVRAGPQGGHALRDVEPALVVEYTVGGALHETREVRWAGVPVWAAASTLRRYPAGARVAVAYDPADPARAVLEPGPSLMRVGYVALGAASAVGGLLWLSFPTRAG